MEEPAGRSRDDVELQGDLNCLVSGTFRVAGAAGGPLVGHTFAAKDIFAIAGWRTSFGHPRWRETHALASDTATVIESFLAAGAELSGLAKLDQLAFSVVGNAGEGEPPLNPAQPGRFCGGSSSGCAAAVAGRLASIGVGTDTAGSIRIPAAACGLFGLRPTHDAISREGVLPLAPPFDVVGLLARDPVVLETAFDAAVPADYGSGSAPLTELVLPLEPLQALGDAGREAVRGFAVRLASSLGVRLREESRPRIVGPEVAQLFTRLQGRSIWENHSSWVVANRDALAPDVRARLDRAREFAAADPDEIASDLESRDAYVGELSQLLGSDRGLVLPVLRDLPPSKTATESELADFRASSVALAVPSSIAGLPQVVAPVSIDRDSPPRAVGILGPARSDRVLLAAVKAGDLQG